jgi:hypothetical protein
MMLSNPREAATVEAMAKKNVRRFALNTGVLAGLLTSSLLSGTVGWAADTPLPAKASRSSAVAKGKAHPTRYAPDRFAGRAGKFYELTWGVDSLNVKLVESGELVRFSYRVLDPVKARSLNDKQSEAWLIDPKAGVRLAVPTMEKVGQLRQSAPPEAGRSYWMTFSNKGGHVVRGDRVDVLIGTFKGSFLAVD